jgi:hypothetical protein
MVNYPNNRYRSSSDPSNTPEKNKRKPRPIRNLGSESSTPGDSTPENKEAEKTT